MMANQASWHKWTMKGSIILVFGVLCALATTSHGLLLMQSISGVSETFAIGRAIFSKNDHWLLLDCRRRRGDPHMIFGLFAGRENGRLPEGRFYSFKDIQYSGYVTFIEVNHDTVERLGRINSEIFGCHRVEKKVGKLIWCQAAQNQILIYDLDRTFVAGVAPAESQLLKRVETMMFEVDAPGLRP